MSRNTISDAEFEQLLELRDGLRRFLRWSEQQAEGVGLTPAQHQLLLAIRGHPDPRGPTIRDVANHLLLRHHSVVELVNRAEAAGLVRRRPDPHDQRSVRLSLSSLGNRRVAKLSALHLEELRRLRGQLRKLWDGLGPA
jgi:DNA-binding MarR family transcriptional regulator